jgi:hypothetical protein
MNISRSMYFTTISLEQIEELEVIHGVGHECLDPATFETDIAWIVPDWLKFLRTHVTRNKKSNMYPYQFFNFGNHTTLKRN